jgi:hypothetical protein
MNVMSVKWEGDCLEMGTTGSRTVKGEDEVGVNMIKVLHMHV